MVARGPKPESTASKKHRGNPGRRPLNDKEPVVEASKLTAPRWLGGEAKKEWKRVATLLYMAGITSQLDRAALASYCEAWGEWVQACKNVAKHGAVMTSETGQAYLSPYLNAKTVANKQMLAAAAQLGMTASSRGQIKALSLPEKSNTTGKGKFFNRRGLKVVG